ncbi:hypothetical protein QYE76_041803 [Lolium multiflorum]|uniref:ATP-dependent DNA helicase n=1 Tax=Lolium multiflorum TaxID=4521 RepID=A0AAD8WUB9_LOLMU|nr:hypothetical protein QYE76_041803 [Lolium multiflorum]
MTEAATFKMPYALRRLFATILVFYEATEIRKLWDKHLPSMSEDYRRDQPNEAALEQMVLRDIRDLVLSMGKDIRSYGLPDLVETDGSYEADYREVYDERQVTADQEHLDLIDCLNSEQLVGFNDIMDHVRNQKSQTFFVDGPGGTGKTYLYKALLAKVRHMGLIAIATATSGIAASIMHGGRIAHSRFKIPIKLTDYSMCGFTKQSGTAEVLKQASLIIWDEVAMTKRQAVETLDRSLQDIMGCPLPFGGKVVVFGGDFRQVLPVVTRGTRAQITDATLLRSYIWENIRKILLTRNMRAQADPWFSEYLLRIGNGTEDTIGDDYVRLPDDIVINYTEDGKAINKLIEDVFPSLHANATSREYMSTRAILSTKNEHVDNLNDKMISRFPGEEKIISDEESSVISDIDEDFTYNQTSEHMLAAQNPELTQTSGMEGPETEGDKLSTPVQIQIPMRRHNKPKRAQDYVVAPEVINAILRCIQVLDSLGSGMHRKDLAAMMEPIIPTEPFIQTQVYDLANGGDLIFERDLFALTEFIGRSPPVFYGGQIADQANGQLQWLIMANLPGKPESPMFADSILRDNTGWMDSPMLGSSRSSAGKTRLLKGNAAHFARHSSVGLPSAYHRAEAPCGSPRLHAVRDSVCTR